MSHEIDMSNERANFCFTGSRSAIWHGLGTEIPEDATIEQWISAAGMNWDVIPTEVNFTIPGEAPLFLPEVKTFDDRKLLYRSDTKAPLSVVGKDFKVVQPKEIVNFFSDLVERHDMKLSTAGVLFEGRRFWALAELGKDFEVISGDKVKGHLLLTTAVDGSLKTTAKFVSTRVVCNNTLSISLSEKGSVISVSHRKEWDPEQVKIDLGLLDESWANFKRDLSKLVGTKIGVEEAFNFFKDLVLPEPEAEFTRRSEKRVNELMDLYTGGVGNELGKGTLWNAVNAVTEQFTHGTGRRQPSHQFWDSYFGAQDQIKSKALSKALEMVA